MPVLLACLLHSGEHQVGPIMKEPTYPSMASKLWYMNSPIAQLDFKD